MNTNGISVTATEIKQLRKNEKDSSNDIRNDDIRQKINEEAIGGKKNKRMLNWFGCIIRKDNNRLAKSTERKDRKEEEERKTEKYTKKEKIMTEKWK